MKKLKLLVIGAGQRGRAYAKYALDNPGKADVVAVAEPRDYYRNQIAHQHSIKQQYVFTDWKDTINCGKIADAVIIATQDKMHTQPAVEYSRLGYDILLEKPMATTVDECEKIVESIKTNQNLFAVAHVLRYTPYTKKVRELVDSGRIGEIVSIQCLEPVGYWHQAHSYVRGNWRNEKESTFMLMGKSCHDLDWIRYFAAAKCNKISSFGNLKHFKKSSKPEGAADRCLECKVESNCPYSAKKIYLGMFREGHTQWPVSYITTDISEEGILESLKTGPYGRCVYECDNDVVDHQVVNMEFENGVTASFTMTAFTPFSHRKTTLFGTRGQITGDGNTIKIYDFLTDTEEEIGVGAAGSGIVGGHGGGDNGLMESFVEAISTKNDNAILSGPQETLESHLMVFAAEKSRLEGKVVYL